MRARYTIEELYPEIEQCHDRAEARYDAHLDLGNQLGAGPLPLFGLAVREFREALRQAPDGAAGRHNLALARWLTGDESSQRELEELAANPHCPLASRNLAVLRGSRCGAVMFATRRPEESELLRLRSSASAVSVTGRALPEDLWRELLC